MRAIATSITLAGGEEGDGDGDNGVGRVTAMSRAMAAVARVMGDEEGNGCEGGKGEGYYDEGGGQRRGR